MLRDDEVRGFRHRDGRFESWPGKLSRPQHCIVPHMLRLMLGPSHRVLPPAATLGAAILVLCDLLFRTIHPPEKISSWMAVDGNSGSNL